MLHKLELMGNAVGKTSFTTTIELPPFVNVSGTISVNIYAVNNYGASTITISRNGIYIKPKGT